MKALTVSEALIALGNGEKITSDFVSNNGYVQFYDGAIRYETNQRCTMIDQILNDKNLRMYEEFTYPMWFKNLKTGTVAKFTSLRGGVKLKDDSFSKDFIPHDDTNFWEQIEEPKKMIKVAKYAYFAVGGVWCESEQYYKCDEDISLAMQYKEFKRLDYTEIEVEAINGKDK